MRLMTQQTCLLEHKFYTQEGQCQTDRKKQTNMLENVSRLKCFRQISVTTATEPVVALQKCACAYMCMCVWDRQRESVFVNTLPITSVSHDYCPDLLFLLFLVSMLTKVRGAMSCCLECACRRMGPSTVTNGTIYSNQCRWDKICTCSYYSLNLSLSHHRWDTSECRKLVHVSIEV